VLIALVSGKGSPGTSTTALAMALAWPGPVLLADCDPRGGDLLWGYGQGKFAAGAGLLSYQVNSRRSSSTVDALWSATVQLGEDRWALPGVDESRQAGSVEWSGLARAFRSAPAGVDVIVDCGVVPAHRPPMAIWTAADLVVLVNRSSLKSTRAALNAGGLVRSDLMSTGYGADRLVSMVVGAGMPYSLADVRQALAGVAPVVGELPWEVRAAATLSDGAVGKRRDLARLTTAAGVLAQIVRQRAAAMDRLGSLALPSSVLPPAPSMPSTNGSMNGSSMNGGAHA